MPNDCRIFTVLIYKKKSEIQVKLTTEHGVLESYLVGGLCDARWHNFALTTVGDKLVVSINGHRSLSVDLPAGWKALDEIFFGGMPGMREFLCLFLISFNF